MRRRHFTTFRDQLLNRRELDVRQFFRLHNPDRLVGHGSDDLSALLCVTAVESLNHIGCPKRHRDILLLLVNQHPQEKPQILTG